LYRDLLISADGSFTTLVLKARARLDGGEAADVLAGFEETEPVPATQKRYLDSEQKAEMVHAVEKLVAPYRAPDFRIHLGGMPVVDVAIQSSIEEDLNRLTPLSLLVSAAFLLLLFRRFSGVFYPMLTVVLSLASTIGAMAALGLPMTDVGHILPTFLLVVGVGDSVHILAIFYRQYNRGDSKTDAMSFALGHSALAVLMTSLTTAGGLASFMVADAAPIADLGIIAPMGVMLALVYTLVLLPALVSLFPLRRGPVQDGRSPRIDRLLSAIAELSCRHARTILWLSCLILLLSLAGISQVRFYHNGLTWLPADSAARNATALMDAKLHGTVTLEAVIDTGRPGGLYEPQFLRRLEASNRRALDFATGEISIGKAWSLDTILKEIHRALNENRPECYALPDQHDLIAQEFLLFEGSGSDDLEELVNRDFSKVRLTMKAPFGDLFKYRRLFDEIKAYFATAYPGAEVQITVILGLFARMVETAILSMVKS
ncbi:MAG: MMPL family transporter, partial [Desulfuromonadaceae bacterium]